MSLRTVFKSTFTELNFMALVLYLSVATQGIASSYKQGAVNTIERRYYLNSRETGFIFGVYDGVFLVMLFVVSFYLDRARNRLVVVASGVLALATGLFTFSLPHYFVVDHEVPNTMRVQENSVALCSNETSDDSNRSSSIDETWLRSFLWKCFLPGNILVAMGATPLYTTGVALLGQNGGRQSLYEPIFYCIAMLAPAIGMVINSKFLQLYINYGGNDKPTWLQNTDPQWLGAWWIGFLINSLAALLLACVLFVCAFCFRSVRLTPNLKKSATVERRLNELSPVNSNCCTRFTYRALHRAKLDEALHTITSLLQNSYFTFMSLYATTEFAANGSIANNLIKFLEIQFALPSSKVSMDVGITGFLAALIGLPMGCYLNKLFGKNKLAIIKMGMLTVSIHLVLMFTFAWPCNDSSKYAGIHVNYDKQFSSPVMNPSSSLKVINATCNCLRKQARFSPVCASSESQTVTFLSACFAGCRATVNNSYADCMYLHETVLHNATLPIKSDKCVQACDHYMILYFTIFMAFFLSIATAIPNISSVMASFPEQYKSVACSLQWLSLRLFGSITSSLVYAEFIKESCIFHVGDNRDSACLLYDHSRFGWAIAGPSVFYKSLGMVFVLCAFFFERRRISAAKRPTAVLDVDDIDNNQHQPLSLRKSQKAQAAKSLLDHDLEFSLDSNVPVAINGAVGQYSTQSTPHNEPVDNS